MPVRRGGVVNRGGMLFALLLLALLVGALALFAAGRSAVAATGLPAGFMERELVGGLTVPTAMEFASDGRLFVAEKGGALRVVKDGVLLPQPFVDLSARVDTTGERGLLGVTFDPDFRQNGYVYAYYTQKAQGGVPARNKIVRFRAAGDVAASGSEESVFTLNKLGEATNHNGGAIHFGEDGKLYAAVEDNAQPENAQVLDNLFGKILRINADGSIPRDNPFHAKAKGKNRAIWAKGLRNPYTFAVQPGTGRIHINDVGAQVYEEINVGRKGANYGWPRYEGPESAKRYQSPLFAYRHEGGPASETGCAITGGAFYDPGTASFPAQYAGDYFFADFCNGWIRTLDADGAEPFLTGIENPVDLKVGDNGNLYYLSLGTGAVYEVRYTG